MGERVEPARALPVPFCRKGLTPPPRTSALVFVDWVPARAGTQSTKTRAEVRGGGVKPFRQKGTGRARAGSTRSPIWVGGGVALGPKPRSYAQKTPKKMIQLALRSALSDRASQDRVVVVDAWDFEIPSTKRGVAALEALGVSGRVLVVLGTRTATPTGPSGTCPRSRPSW